MASGFATSTTAPEKNVLWWSVHVILPLALFIMGLLAAWYRIYTFYADDGDYGLFTNLLWNLAHGNGWQVSIYHGEVRYNFLADHFALIAPLFSPFFSLFPSPYTLSTLHSVAFGAVFFLVPVLVKHIWNDNGKQDYLKAALFILLALYFFKGFAAAWRYQTHMTTLITPFLLSALIMLHKRKLGWAVFFCVLVALGQERAVVAVFGIGMYAFFITGHRRLGAVLCLFSTVYFFAIVKVIIPSFYHGPEGYFYNRNIQPFEDIQKKLVFLLNTYVYWFFLPLLGRKAFLSSLCAMPVIAVGLVSNRDSMYAFIHQYQDMPSIFLAAAAAQGVFWFLQQPRVGKLPRMAVPFLAMLCLLVSAKISRHPSSWQHLVRWNIDNKTHQLNEELKPFLNLPENLTVYTLGKPGPRLSLRDKRRRFTPENAVEPFTESVVVIAVDPDQYPFTLEQIQPPLDNNASLRVVFASDVLRVYASTDIASSMAP